MHLPLPPAPTIAIVGPSGVGKNTLIELVCSISPDLSYGQSRTTRQPRPTDLEGQYLYSSMSEILEALAANKILEWASFAGNAYATCTPDPARPTIIDLELKGAAQLMAYFRDKLPITFIGILPMISYNGTDRMSAEEQRDLHRRMPSALEGARIKVLRDHLMRRGDLSPEKLNERLIIAQLEMKEIESRWPDLPNTHIVMNIDGERELAVAEIARLVRLEINAWRDSCDEIKDAELTHLKQDNNTLMSQIEQVSKQFVRLNPFVDHLRKEGLR